MRLEASNLACDRGGRRVFEGVSFAVGSGRCLVVTGPNGAGKSTLLRLVAGFVRAASGTVTLEGGAPETPLREQVHYFGHQDALKPALTLAETLGFWADMLGNGSARVEEALAAVGLDHLADVAAGTLSAGQRRRLGIARLVAIDRPIWLLDEPTTAIDAASEANLGRLIAAHLSGGGIVVAATHADLALPDPVRLGLGAAG